MKWERITSSLEETRAFAYEFAKDCQSGDVLAFRGPMGAGKTAFICALSEALGCKGEAASPTFAIVNEYPGNPSLIHFDWYRLEDEEELLLTGYYDYLESGAILAIEWSENFPEELPTDTRYVTIIPISDRERKITVTERKEAEE